MDNSALMKIDCPFHDDGFVTIPDRWLGSHYLTYLEVMDSAKDTKGVLKKFAVSIVLCDNYDLPGMSGKPEQWDLSQVDLQLMAWVSTVVYDSFMACFTFPKKKLSHTTDLLNLISQSGTLPTMAS